MRSMKPHRTKAISVRLRISFLNLNLEMSLHSSIANWRCTESETHSFCGKVSESNKTWCYLIPPCKGIKDSLGFWFPSRRFRIPATGFYPLLVELGFSIANVSEIPDSFSWIPGFKNQDSGMRGFRYMGRWCRIWALSVKWTFSSWPLMFWSFNFNSYYFTTMASFTRAACKESL